MVKRKTGLRTPNQLVNIPRTLWPVCVFFLALAACVGRPDVGGGPADAVTAVRAIGSEPALTQQIGTDLPPSPSSTPTLPRSPTTSPRLTATFPLILVPTATDTPVEICSPLGGYGFSDLPLIVSSGFVEPQPGRDDGHHGTDFAHYQFGEKTTIAGAPVQAMFDGVIAAAIADSWPYGHFIIVESNPEQIPPDILKSFRIGDRSVYHLYAHLGEVPDITPGERVLCGELIGAVGSSGASGNFHLHLELRMGLPGIRFESMAYYHTGTTEEERANYEAWRLVGIPGSLFLLDPMVLICGGGRCVP